MSGPPSLDRVPLLRQITCFTTVFHSLLAKLGTRKAIAWTEHSPKAHLAQTGPWVSSNSLTVLSWLLRKNKCRALALLEETSRAHQKRYGTHTTYLIVLTGLLSAKATRLLEEGFEAEEVCWHLQRFRADVQQLLTHEALDICDISDADFKTGVCHGLERTAGDAAFAVAQQLRREDTTGNWHFGSILVKRRVLNCAPQCQVLDGVFLQTTACSSNVVRKLLQNLQIGKLAIVVGKLGRLADESGSRSAASLHPKALNKLPTLGSSAEAKDVSFVHRVCTSLLELGVTVVVSAEMVEETVVRVCAEPYGVLVIPNVSMADVEFLARHFGCFLLNRLVDLSENSVSKLCAVVTEVKGFNAEGQGLMISPRDASGRVQLRGYHPTNPVCILCTAMASALCDTLESTFWSTLYRLRNMQTNRKLCIGGCVTEKAIRRRLDTKQLGRCASTFAEAIEELENIVERNLGFSARDGTCPVFDDTQGKEAAIARALGLIELCLFGTLL